MNHDQFINLLFYPRPDRWGLRGDPMFWTDLENHMRLLSFPSNEHELKNHLFHLYEQLIGTPLIKNGVAKVEKYKQMGMSSGAVSANFWLDTGFPLIIERYRTYNEQHAY